MALNTCDNYKFMNLGVSKYVLERKLRRFVRIDCFYSIDLHNACGRLLMRLYFTEIEACRSVELEKSKEFTRTEL